jgi:hypothetical protein
MKPFGRFQSHSLPAAQPQDANPADERSDFRQPCLVTIRPFQRWIFSINEDHVKEGVHTPRTPAFIQYLVTPMKLFHPLAISSWLSSPIPHTCPNAATNSGIWTSVSSNTRTEMTLRPIRLRSLRDGECSSEYRCLGWQTFVSRPKCGNCTDGRLTIYLYLMSVGRRRVSPLLLLSILYMSYDDVMEMRR